MKGPVFNQAADTENLQLTCNQLATVFNQAADTESTKSAGNLNEEFSGGFFFTYCPTVQFFCPILSFRDNWNTVPRQRKGLENQ